MKTKKNLQNDIEDFVENFAFSVANDQKIDCPVCFKYVGWLKKFDDEKVK